MFEKLDALVDVLRAAGVRADTDSTKVVLPGCWVAGVDYRPVDTLGCDSWVATVFMIAEDRDHPKARAQIEALWAKVKTAVTPDSPLRPQTVTIDLGALPMPCVAFEVKVT